MIAVRPYLFGKLPGFGDFVVRGLTAEARAGWDARCSAAVAQAQARLGPAFDRLFEATPPRSFCWPGPGAGGPWEAGIVAASRDRVGRPYLFVLGAVVGPPAERPAPPVFDRLRSCLYDAFAQPPPALEALLAAVAAMFRDAAGSDASAIADWQPWDSDWIGSPDMAADMPPDMPIADGGPRA